MDFDELRAERRAIRNFVNVHAASVLQFQSGPAESGESELAKEGPSWFRLTLTEEERDDEVRPPHLSTSASCLESLADAGMGRRRPLDGERYEIARRFARRALDADPRTWRSEGAADVYCRARTLPAVVRFLDSWTKKDQKRVAQLLTETFQVVDVEHPSLGGVMEWPLYPDRKGNIELPDFTKPNARDDAYPPNGFHTYWALRALAAFDKRPGTDTSLLDSSRTPARTARAWAEKLLAEQAALIGGKAERVDAQQLAYGLATDLLCATERLVAGSQRYDLYRASLDAFFAEQRDSGSWPQSEPLFHYPAAGNAYCFPFETLTELLRPALPRETGRVYRTLLFGYVDKLLTAWHLARRTRILLDEVETRAPHYGWSSTHHPHRPQPEAWATAGVYSYLQVLRCVIGHWTAEEAARQVGARVTEQASAAKAREHLADRGRTWEAAPPWTVGRRLASLFLHPRTAEYSGPDVVDPDGKLMDEHDARSALLFGPPGTGKTTLVRELAGALGWQFVEIQAADFLSEGMDKVPARADEIFAALMELDRCVVLFDEIDELIRLRTDTQTDPFGRFLTTSMLPKLAQLWDQRKVLFFANTNHVEKADPAIRRSQRFDAAVLVMPPTFAKKMDLLAGTWREVLTEEEVRTALAADPETDSDPLGVLALLRYDQIGLLSNVPNGDREALLTRLKEIAVGLARNEWVPPDPKQDGANLVDPQAAMKQLYAMYRGYVQQERLDPSRRQFASVPESLLEDALFEAVQVDGKPGRIGELWLVSLDGELVAEMKDDDDRIVLARDAASFRDDELLSFEATD